MVSGGRPLPNSTGDALSLAEVQGHARVLLPEVELRPERAHRPIERRGNIPRRRRAERSVVDHGARLQTAGREYPGLADAARMGCDQARSAQFPRGLRDPESADDQDRRR